MAKKRGEVFAKARQRENEIKAEQTTATESKDAFGDLIETAPRRRKRPKGMTEVSTGAGYHDFVKEPVYEGCFVSKFLAPKDIPSNRTKKGDCIGFNFADPDTGKISIISNSYSIQKALEEDGFKTTTKWWIEFEGKTVIKGKPFNRFYIAKH